MQSFQNLQVVKRQQVEEFAKRLIFPISRPAVAISEKSSIYINYFKCHKTHFRSDEGLTFETSALKLLTYLIRYRLYRDPNPISKVAYLPLPRSKFYNWNPIPILINSTPSKTWLEKLNAGELRGQASKTNLNLRGIAMRAFAPVWAIFSKRRGLWKRVWV